LPQPNPDTHADANPVGPASDADANDNTATGESDAVGSAGNSDANPNGDTEAYPNAKTSADTASSAVSQ
jgi:hypothetical protein